MQKENSFNIKKRKLRLQAMVLTIISILWVAGMLGILLNSLSKHEQVDQLIESLSAVNMQISDYYEATLTDLSEEALRLQTDGRELDVEKIEQLNENIHIAVENSITLADTMNLEAQSDTDLYQIQEAVGELARIESTINEGYSFEVVMARMLPVLKEIDQANQTAISELGSYQQLRTSKLYKEMVFGTLCVIALFAVSNIWLMILKTLNPIHVMKNALEESKAAYRTSPVKIDGDNEIGDLVTSYNQMRLRTQMIEGLVEKLYGHTHFEQILDFVFDQF